MDIRDYEYIVTFPDQPRQLRRILLCHDYHRSPAPGKLPERGQYCDRQGAACPVGILTYGAAAPARSPGLTAPSSALSAIRLPTDIRRGSIKRIQTAF